MPDPSNIAPCMGATVADQLQYESRVRLRYGVIAFIAALLLVGSQVLQFVGPSTDVTELTLSLITAHKREALDIGGAVVYLFSMLGLAALLGWVFGASRFRNPEMKPFIGWMVQIGPVLAGVMYLAYMVLLGSKANTFVSTGSQGYPQANSLTSGGLIDVLPLLWQLGTLVLTIGVIWTSLNAMRVGLVTKAVGYAGVIAGALFLFPISGLAPLVQGFWLAAVAVTLAARWPSGDLPAWTSGTAVPWPTPQRAAAQQRQPRQPRGRRKVSDQEVLAAVDREPQYRTDAPSPSTSAGKRKRKRK